MCIRDRTYLHSILRHRIAARHCKLIDAAICLSFDADDLIKLRRVEIDSGWRGGCGWRRQWRLTCPESLTNNGGHFGRIAVAADMHVEGRGTRPQQVVMDGG